MGTLLVIHNGSQFKEQFAEHSTETAQDLGGIRVAMVRRRFDAVCVDAANYEGQLGEMLAAVRAADPCVAVVVGGNGWPAELRSVAESCEVLIQAGPLEVAQCAVRRAMRLTVMMREHRELKAKLESVRGGADGNSAGRDASDPLGEAADRLT